MLSARVWLSPLRLHLRRYSTHFDVAHADFLANSKPNSRWKESEDEAVGEHGKLLPTSSHLFKLILPLQLLKFEEHAVKKLPLGESQAPPTVMLLHPSQPLSHVARLVLASVAPATPTISFRSHGRKQEAQWSDSTDVGDFIRDAAARAGKFSLCISYDPSPSTHTSTKIENSVHSEVVLEVQRLASIERQLRDMEELKRACDHEAKRGARRMATAGFGLLAVYWGGVARLTFWDYGWDVMEPITYLSGLSTVMAGYLWFLYQGREVSYSSVLDRSIDSRRETLYKARGFDIEQWLDLSSEARRLRGEIRRVEGEYAGAYEDKENREAGEGKDEQEDGKGTKREEKE
ncbi:hypothetical protein FB45DRAFT_898414 [Roridomyces roridus]|uniref:Calcium uniporter protein, mitochondrial n=1 Tax=Roridomyces roridus TaxID=1738132 RepID=A0AAD7CCL4_9AGAR|nr:hypothetical protein FB45DRAFT_898414 [Roridomyces roridus]